MRVVAQHRSRYYSPRPALLCPQLIRLRPADHTRARIVSYQLLVEPEHRLHWLRDPHGNRVARVTFKAGQAVSELHVLVELAVEINAINPFVFFIDDRALKVPFVSPTGRVGIAPSECDRGRRDSLDVHRGICDPPPTRAN